MLEPVLERAIEALTQQRNLEQTLAELQAAQAKADLPAIVHGQLAYYSALTTYSLKAYSQASHYFLLALNLLQTDEQMFYQVLQRFVAFAEEFNLLELASQAVAAAHERYPNDAWIGAKIRHLTTQRFETPYPEQSNLGHWKEMQAQGYFDRHPHYQAGEGLIEGGNDLEIIAESTSLGPNDAVAVIGCGYGRESALLAPVVKTVYGIDVMPELLERARLYLAQRQLTNFVPVLADEWRQKLPDGLRLVYTVTVFQHLTKHLVEAYVCGMAEKLAADGRLVCQFMYSHTGTHDAILATYEPHVSWAPQEIQALMARAGLEILQLKQVLANAEENIHWLWLHARKPSTM